MSRRYTVYHLHSDFSLVDSCTKFEDYVDAALSQGMTAIASTEHGRPLGWVSKKMYCDEKGIKFMHGVEMYLTESLTEKVRDNYHTVLIAKNAAGVRELNRLIELSGDDDHFYYNPRLSFEEFVSLSDNIIKTSACLASPLNKLPDDHPWYMKLARHYDYLEIQPHNCEDQIAYNKRLLDLSRKIGKPLIAGTDTHSLNPYKAECRKVLINYKRHGKQMYSDEDAFDMSWKTYDELTDAFRIQNAIPAEEYLAAIDNTNVLADSVEDFELDKSIKYPILYGSHEADAIKFVETIERKFAEKIDRGIIYPHQVEAFRAAIDEEVAVFRKLQMDGFMLSMGELISWCKEEGMAIGTARGSVGGSRVAYILDIIDLNPETWHTVFSRFCNEDRLEIGDIDVDCVEEDRPRIFKHIVEKYGKKHTARVGSYGTLADLATIDTIGGHLAIEFEKLCKERGIPYDAKDNLWSLKKIKDIKKLYQSNPDDARKRYPELFYYFDGLVGTRVSQSVHPAGMVISPLNLSEEYGVFQKDDELCLTIDMEDLHEVGAAKYDLLVLRNVQIIRDTCRNIGIPYPRTHEINWNDEAVWKDMLRSPVGIFQFESPSGFKSLKEFKPTSIFDMSLVTAAIRPSGASYRNELLSRKQHGNPSALIDELLKDNLGYLVYQEDIIAFLQQVCGLTGSESDTVRRGIARKHPEILEEYLPRILNGYCSRSDKPRSEAEEEANEFLRIIEDASSYMFG